jgi:hypothetical protein
MHGLPFDEVDADDLSLDLAAHDDRVIGDDGANTGQIDRHVMLSDRSGDDRHDRRCCSILRRWSFEGEFMGDGETTADRQDGNQQSSGNDNLASHLSPALCLRCCSTRTGRHRGSSRRGCSNRRAWGRAPRCRNGRRRIGAHNGGWGAEASGSEFGRARRNSKPADG